MTTQEQKVCDQFYMYVEVPSRNMYRMLSIMIIADYIQHMSRLSTHGRSTITRWFRHTGRLPGVLGAYHVQKSK